MLRNDSAVKRCRPYSKCGLSLSHLVEYFMWQVRREILGTTVTIVDKTCQTHYQVDWRIITITYLAGSYLQLSIMQREVINELNFPVIF